MSYGRAERLHAGQGRSAIGARGEIRKMRRAFCECGQHSVAVADRFVARQAQAAEQVARGTNDAFLRCSVHAGKLHR